METTRYQNRVKTLRRTISIVVNRTFATEKRVWPPSGAENIWLDSRTEISLVVVRKYPHWHSILVWYDTVGEKGEGKQPQQRPREL